jgi:hypothetical protein
LPRRYEPRAVSIDLLIYKKITTMLLTMKQSFMKECAKHIEACTNGNTDKEYHTVLKTTSTTGVGGAVVTALFKGTTDEVSAQVGNIDNSFDDHLRHKQDSAIKILSFYIYCVKKTSKPI